MPGKILAHLDCASPYSYFAFTHLRKIRPILDTYNITIDFVPIFLGGVNHATGNVPPSTLPARGKYLPFDMKRTIEQFDTVKLTSPPFFPMVSLLPQRCMCVVKQKYSRDIFEQVYERLWVWVFNKHVDLAKPENMKAALLEGGDLSEDQANEIIRLAGTKEVKAELNENTRRVIEEYGAYGAPWLWVIRTDETGNEELAEPVFGSDRFVYVYRLLGLDFENVKLHGKGEGNAQIVAPSKL